MDILLMFGVIKLVRNMWKKFGNSADRYFDYLDESIKADKIKQQKQFDNEIAEKVTKYNNENGTSFDTLEEISQHQLYKFVVKYNNENGTSFDTFDECSQHLDSKCQKIKDMFKDIF